MATSTGAAPAVAASPLPMEGPIATLLRERIAAALNPSHFELENESRKHNVPPGSESHFKVFVVAQAFEGKPLIARHRMVQDAVKAGAADLPVHALSIQAKTPEQFAGGGAMHTTPNCKGGSER